MAVTQTGAIYKALSFDNTSSRSYGVYITGEAVYNAPERDVEMIEIPGRNGAFAMDKGRFQNIEVTYPAGIFASTEADFRQAISDFRNFLCSKKGYVRLTDDYNPDEYRLAVYKSGLEVSPTMLKAGEFEIKFDCKPQRFLTSGETSSTVANNGTLSNPTLFPSSPLLEVTGYGNVAFNGHTIAINNANYGSIELTEWWREYLNSMSGTKSSTFYSGYVNSGNPIALKSLIVNDGSADHSSSLSLFANFTYNSSYSVGTMTKSATNLSYYSAMKFAQQPKVGCDLYLNTKTFTAGTSSSLTGQLAVQIPLINSSNTTVETATITMQIQLSYNGSNTITASYTISITNDTLGAFSLSDVTLTQSEAIATSTASVLGNPTYIDCDLGEAYKIENNATVPLNAYIDMGSSLPTLKPGTNTFTKSNTVTTLKCTPRWWKV